MSTIQEKCPRCGTRWNKVSRFCPVCNYEFQGTMPEPQRHRSAPSPQPQQVLEPGFPKPARPQPVIFEETGHSPATPVSWTANFSLFEVLKRLFGYGTLTGKVVSVFRDKAYPESNWPRIVLIVVIVLVVLGMLGSIAEQMFEQVIMPFIATIFGLWILLTLIWRMFQGILGEFIPSNRPRMSPFSLLMLPTSINGFMRFLFGDRSKREPIPVMLIRLEVEGDHSYRDVRMEGQMVGNLEVGDKIEVHGFYRGGTLIFRRGWNKKTNNSEIIVNRNVH